MKRLTTVQENERVYSHYHKWWPTFTEAEKRAAAAKLGAALAEADRHLSDELMDYMFSKAHLEQNSAEAGVQ